MDLFEPSQPDFVVVFIPGYELQYSWEPEETHILKTRHTFGIVNGSSVDSRERTVVCNFKEHFPIDWNNIDHTIQRLKTLIVFS
jgi:hypothetical protein